MRVIARSTLTGFVQNRVPPALREIVGSQLNAWYREALRATWKNSAEVKQKYGSASIVSSERIVFNIKGNDYRLVVAIKYKFQSIRALWLGTHREYDKIDVNEVQYDERRDHTPSSP